MKGMYEADITKYLAVEFWDKSSLRYFFISLKKINKYSFLQNFPFPYNPHRLSHLRWVADLKIVHFHNKLINYVGQYA